jgi:hypothetical protein
MIFPVEIIDKILAFSDINTCIILSEFASLYAIRKRIHINDQPAIEKYMLTRKFNDLCEFDERHLEYTTLIHYTPVCYYHYNTLPNNTKEQYFQLVKQNSQLLQDTCISFTPYDKSININI